jgi:serine/threonine-protein kinase
VAFLRFLVRLAYVVLLAAVMAASGWISFRWFIQGRSVPVPELAGKELEDARRLVADKGLDLEVQEDLAQHDDRFPSGRIRLQNPAAGTSVKQGATIRVALSLGARILQVPDLTALTSRTAAIQLERIGLALGSVTQVPIAGIAGIVSQDPPPGERIAPGTTVSVLIARDPGPPRRILPDFVGDDLDRAKGELEAFGYRLGPIRSESYEGVPENRILRQYPLAGYPAPPGFAVSFVVSRGSAVGVGKP